MGQRIDDPMLFDWEDFWTSEDVEMMTAEQALAYARLLSQQWRDGDLPADPTRLAVKMSSGVRQYTAVDVVGAEATLEAPLEGSLWPPLKGCFIATEDGSGRLFNPRVKMERDKWLTKRAGWREAGAKGGRKSGRARRAKRSKALITKDLEANTKPPLEPPLKPPLKGASSQPQATPSRASRSSSRSMSMSEREEKDTAKPRKAGAAAPRRQAGGSRSSPDAQFEIWWFDYPKKTGRKKALERWHAISPKERPSGDTVREFIRKAEGTDRWKEGYIKGGDRFVQERSWEDDLAAYGNGTGPGRGPRHTSPARRAGAQPEDEQQALDEELTWRY
jgi:hypothetical protein